MKVEFTKMHGLGNDYIYVNTDNYPIADPEAFSIRWSKPHTGIGSDGLVLISRSDVADFRMRIFNADGSEAMMCGNASRCIGKYVYEKGLTDKNSVTLETLSGIKVLDLKVCDGSVEEVTVDMGEPLLCNTQQVATADGALHADHQNLLEGIDNATFVCMGNPHVVIFVDDMASTPVDKWGPEIEHSPLFPERVNVEFVQVLPDGKLRMRVWERGSGITQACGTGACATAVAAFVTGRANRKSQIVMDGGSLTIEYRQTDGRIYMTGTATTAFEGTLTDSISCTGKDYNTP